MTSEHLNLFLAVLTILLAIIATVVAYQTLRYMRRRDSEVDTRNGWIAIHKAMINLRVQRSFYMAGVHNTNEESIRDFTLAAAQLRGQLNRLNDEPLTMELADFLDENGLTAQWQTQEFEKAFDAFAHKVAMRSRPV